MLLSTYRLDAFRPSDKVVDECPNHRNQKDKEHPRNLVTTLNRSLTRSRNAMCFALIATPNATGKKHMRLIVGKRCYHL